MSGGAAAAPSPVSLVEWWRRVEDAVLRGPDAAVQGQSDFPSWLLSLSRAYGFYQAYQLQAAREAVTETLAEAPAGSWRRVAALIEAGIEVRQAHPETLNAMTPRIRSLMAELREDETSTLARAWHLLGSLHTRLNQYADAEVALFEALRVIEESPAKTWILDGCGDNLVTVGAFVEGLRTLRAVMKRREEMADRTGLAITAGRLALVDLNQGRPAAAAACLASVLDRHGAALSKGSRLRLETMLLQAHVDMEDRHKAEEAASRLRDLLRESGMEKHYLGGYAALALARFAGLMGSRGIVREWLLRAEQAFKLDDQLALLYLWKMKLLADEVDLSVWCAEMEALFSRIEVVTEVEVMTHLYLAERAASAMQLAVMRERLDKALERAVQSNNPQWLDRVDCTYRRLDPDRLGERLVERFTGRPAEELRRTVKEEATIVFSDLVNFTPRSRELSPEVVMETVRSLFELSVTLMRAHRVRPISYLGDGLLAVSQGPDHRKRGLQFALDMVQRAGRVTLIRRALGEKWGLDLRAGVASGPVVLGGLGNLLKMEYAAIGLTTNLAARLQSQALPGQVVCEYETAGENFARGQEEWLELKGFDPVKVHAVRFGQISPSRV